MNQEDDYGDDEFRRRPLEGKGFTFEVVVEPLRRCEEHKIIECRQCFYVLPPPPALRGICRRCERDCEEHRPTPRAAKRHELRTTEEKS